MKTARLGALDLDDVLAESDAPNRDAPSRTRILDGQGAGASLSRVARAPDPKSGSAPAAPTHPPRPAAMVNLSDNLTRIGQLNGELAEMKARIEAGALVETLDVDLVDPSPFPDRLETTFRLSAFEELKESIRRDGQDQPILVRPHPTSPGRYQVAYGHRRRRACAELGLKIDAIVRELDDDAMIAAQRRENQEREQPSYIERVFQVAALFDAGYNQTQIGHLVGIDQSLVSRMLQTRLLGIPLVEAIGPCPKSGRRAWEGLQDLVVEKGLREEALEALADIDTQDGDKRLSELVRRLKRDDEDPGEARDILTHKGVRIGRCTTKPRSAVLQFKGLPARDFCDWLAREIPDLHRRYLAEKA